MGLIDFNVTLIWLSKENIREQPFHVLGNKNLACPHQFAEFLLYAATKFISIMNKYIHLEKNWFLPNKFIKHRQPFMRSPQTIQRKVIELWPLKSTNLSFPTDQSSSVWITIKNPTTKIRFRIQNRAYIMKRIIDRTSMLQFMIKYMDLKVDTIRLFIKPKI